MHRTIYFVFALIATTLGGIAASAQGIGPILFVVFTALAVAGFLTGLGKRA